MDILKTRRSVGDKTYTHQQACRLLEEYITLHGPIALAVAEDEMRQKGRYSHPAAEARISKGWRQR
jgi:hypothetical protein